jgi:UDP-2,4-diacetamido-2,4,6-trideoxy-beta-L-altropyranose hydrolase
MNIETTLEKINLRRATMDDAQSILSWRNDPQIRAQSFNSSVIDWQAHNSWFQKTLQCKDKLILIGEIDNSPVGVLRFDLSENVAEVNIYLVPGLQGNGLGALLLKAGTKWLNQHFNTIKKIIAKVLCGNVASEKTFKKVGFKDYYNVYQLSLDETV